MRLCALGEKMAPGWKSRQETFRAPMRVDRIKYNVITLSRPPDNGATHKALRHFLQEISSLEFGELFSRF